MTTSTDTHEAANKIDEASNFIFAIHMAAGATEADHASALKEICGAAIVCLNEARAALFPHEAATCSKRIGDRG